MIRADMISTVGRDYLTKTINVNRQCGEADVEYGFTLYDSYPANPKDLKWNWLLQIFGRNTVRSYSSPSAVLLIEKDDDNVYAVAFGHSFS